MIALSVAKQKCIRRKAKFFSYKAKKEEINFFLESLDQCRRLEVGEKARLVFCDEPTSV